MKERDFKQKHLQMILNGKRLRYKSKKVRVLVNKKLKIVTALMDNRWLSINKSQTSIAVIL